MSKTSVCKDKKNFISPWFETYHAATLVSLLHAISGELCYSFFLKLSLSAILLLNLN